MGSLSPIVENLSLEENSSSSAESSDSESLLISDVEMSTSEEEFNVYFTKAFKSKPFHHPVKTSDSDKWKVCQDRYDTVIIPAKSVVFFQLNLRLSADLTNITSVLTLSDFCKRIYTNLYLVNHLGEASRSNIMISNVHHQAIRVGFVNASAVTTVYLPHRFYLFDLSFRERFIYDVTRNVSLVYKEPFDFNVGLLACYGPQMTRFYDYKKDVYDVQCLYFMVEREVEDEVGWAPNYSNVWIRE